MPIKLIVFILQTHNTKLYSNISYAYKNNSLTEISMRESFYAITSFPMCEDISVQGCCCCEISLHRKNLLHFPTSQ